MALTPTRRTTRNPKARYTMCLGLMAVYGSINLLPAEALAAEDASGGGTAKTDAGPQQPTQDGNTGKPYEKVKTQKQKQETTGGSGGAGKKGS